RFARRKPRKSRSRWVSGGRVPGKEYSKEPSMSLVRMACVSMLAATVSIVWSSAGARTMQDVLEASKPSDWRALDPEQTLYVEFSAGRVIIELAPQFAPRHVENIKTLVRERYFD